MDTGIVWNATSSLWHKVAMPETCPPPFRVRSKVWVENDRGEVIFGFGRLNFLGIIRELGSIQAAASRLGMSYRGLWGRIKATEERLGSPLLLRSVGGSAGGGARLTPFALELIEQFQRLNRDVQTNADERFSAELARSLGCTPEESRKPRKRRKSAGSP